ncbi:MAG: hypothetical protein A2821_02450 [Candidatus Magasanikbacteria bacterium RIFCSPHIGHO2_01_FULL_41_23]|uniref:Thioredoxin-like fold domain-containing protein n=1 Tax=Candidatus Magasanikbacteria bacterium RIFCSPLOWO2_01_FULL_40_15 TaxID=1798686 RepID=A0A1F6N306_9BACT|nr:MAG: hypothetical protein A2821_02450 [Candidatus Magasanikbacteria bacterium RIFCSPHIGHO2_01_FULL_41_23]OGH66870.1 MAG: hypothetical protein A3C66_02230 [Candidatus Magasanikbacteria bacterium RIFCSPHIGHO2_02_FULL_41_35]OGH74854.1 MAG: hypothetical protein A3F22_04160 [Candidatus Magasanikbacteria bacterium RIFCSPHIGHO2_12_FULL_41_16]OGH78128.1 MAG: hypothetical protein A2983_03580 [Candidatus Magasanikbacteria bacterium RIFCSPLOWO2_01_FULL_40_15]
MSIKKMILIFIPALLVVGFALFIQVLRYEPLFPKKNTSSSDGEKPPEFSIPFSITDPIIGQKRAGKTIVAFEDFGCHRCKQYDEILTQLVAKHPNAIKIIWKGLPVTRFPYPSELALKYGFCAHSQKKFTEFKNQAFILNDQLSDATLKKIAVDIALDSTDLEKCLAAPATENYIFQNKNLALQLNIQAVPTFFVDNKQVEEAETVEGWADILAIKSN